MPRILSGICDVSWAPRMRLTICLSTITVYTVLTCWFVVHLSRQIPAVAPSLQELELTGPEFPTWIGDYAKFHADESTDRYLIWACMNGESCGGIGDRTRGIVTSFFLAIATNRKLLIYNNSPADLIDILTPAHIDWTSNAKSEYLSAKVTINSMDHISDKLFELSSPEMDQVRSIVIKTNYPVWVQIMNSKLYQNRLEQLGIPYGNWTQPTAEILFTWAWNFLMKPSKTLVEAIQVKKERAGLAPNSQFIAVHIRAGGHWGDPGRHNGARVVDDFAQCVSEMRQEVGDLPVYVASDDTGIKASFSHRVSNVGFDGVASPFHVDRSEHVAVIEGHLGSWAEFYLQSESVCSVISVSGFSQWPVAISRDLLTGARCFARFDQCSREMIQRSMRDIIAVRD